MSRITVQLHQPDVLGGVLDAGALRHAMESVANLAGAELDFRQNDGNQAADGLHDLPLFHRGESIGKISYPQAATCNGVGSAGNALHHLIEHMFAREMAVEDLAAAIMTSYEELDMLYGLLPAMATRLDQEEIGETLVAETSRLLRCKRVSLLVLDEAQSAFKVVASRGLPGNLRGVMIPLRNSMVARALDEEDMLVVDSLSERSDLASLARGGYESEGFAVVRVPLKARGEALGFLTVTDRQDHADFSARDLKLLDGLSALGASALLGSRLHESVNKQMLSTIQALASAVEAKDNYTRDHAGRVANYCMRTAERLGIRDNKRLREIELAGLLHDVGKIGIPDAILTKTSRLTRDEFNVIQSHVRIGADIVRHVPGLECVADAIFFHHERFDGLGYLEGLRGDDIPLASRLIAVADTFDSITTERPYRKAAPTETAITEVRRAAGTQLDPRVVDAFGQVIARDGAMPVPARGRTFVAAC